MRDLATKWPDLHALTERDVDAQAARFRTGVVNWVLQTYLHLIEPLHAAGVSTSISESVKPGAVNIVHRDSLNGISSEARRATIIGVRADRPPFELADFEVLQNNVQPLDAHQFYIPFWPQPGLQSRDAGRGGRLEHLVYLGNTGTASPWLRDPEFLRSLAGLDMSFEIRAKQWFDYREVDLVLAHRAEAPCMVVHKPASKLINAWLARSVALLGPEPAYLKLRESPLDYLPVDSPAEVLAAIRRLRGEPGLYEAMVAHGQRRGAEFSVDAVRRRWLKLILEVALPQCDEIARSKRWLGQLARLTAQKAQSRMFKWRYRREIAGGRRFTAPPDPL
jgi:hypothetical protein